MKGASDYLLNFIEMSLLGMGMKLPSLSDHNWALFSLPALLALHPTSDPPNSANAFAIGLVNVSLCQNRKKLVFSHVQYNRFSYFEVE